MNLEGSITLRQVTGNYVWLDRPYITKDSRPNYYTMRVIMRTDHPDFPGFIQTVQHWIEQCRAGDHRPITAPYQFAENAENLDLEKWPIYRDSIFFTARRQERPEIKNAYLEKASRRQIDELTYWGANYHVVLSPYRYQTRQAEGIGLSLDGVVLLGGGTKFRRPRKANFSGLEARREG